MRLERTRTRACPGCGGVRASAAETAVPDFKYRVPGVWAFLRCTDCGLVYLAEPLTSPSEGYPAVYTQHRPAGRVRLERPWSLRRDIRNAFLEQHGYRASERRLMPRPLARCLLAVPPVRLAAGYSFLFVPPALRDGRLLDIGCGNGRFLTVMGTLGWRVHGIEPDELSAAVARRSSGAPIHPGLDDELYPPAHFDVINMNHVLEHVTDPVTLLQRCFWLCRPGGLIAIVVPNWRALGHRLFKRSWYALEPPRHVVMFEPRTLERTLERAGFRVETVGTTSRREWATAWRRSWRYRTGRASSRPLLAAWAGLTALGCIVADDVGEELYAWARRP